MPGPFTAFTYGDPACINQYPNNPNWAASGGAKCSMFLGLTLGLSYTPVPVAQVLQGGVVGTAYSETISVQGGTAPYTFSVSSGSVPAGLSLNASTGVISGTPGGAGTSTFTIKVVDVNGFIGTQSFTITIAAPSAASNPSWAWFG